MCSMYSTQVVWHLRYYQKAHGITSTHFAEYVVEDVDQAFVGDAVPLHLYLIIAQGNSKPRHPKMMPLMLSKVMQLQI